MRSVRVFWFGMMFWCACQGRGSPTLVAADATLAPSTDETTTDLVRQALAAEAKGHASERAQLLQRALQQQPDCAPAHWQSGDVHVGDRWLSVDTATQEAASAGYVDKYRELRRRVRPNAADHLSVARWCSQQELPEQERLHLLLALRYAPKSDEAIKKLGLMRHNGTLLPRAQVKAMGEHAKESAAALKTWKPRLLKLRHDIESNDTSRQIEAKQTLESIDDPLVIPALESLTINGRAEIGKAVVASLTKMPGQLATDSLARHATFAEQVVVRKAASEALQSRSVFSYVPTMMFAMQLPSDVQFDSYYTNGQFFHRLAIFQHGLFADKSFVSTGGTSEQIIFSRRYGDSDTFIPDRTLLSDSLLAKQEVHANKARELVNGRIAAALQTATGNDLPADPQNWWDWWLDYNEIYRPPVNPVYQTVRNYTPPPSSVRYRSCFVAGTKVWTSTGSMAIEQVQTGECVLAQDIETGELAFKPVIDTTVRPPSPLVAISAGGELIHATRGHPFWISGIGWQMAKELKSGQMLHTPRGPLAIDSISEADPATCYNLIVADFGTYFVTDQQVLVHDNNLRQVTTATVPGLIAP